MKLMLHRNIPASRLKGKVAFINKENINQILAEMECPKEFDLLSLDVDQNTYHVWDGLMDYRPRLIVVEYNATIPPEIDWKCTYSPDRTWDGTANFGASLKALELLGLKKGYHLVGCDFSGVNAFFVRSDLVAEGLFKSPYTSENHYQPPRHPGPDQAQGHPRSLLDLN
jgi:hypothetical protein